MSRMSDNVLVVTRVHMQAASKRPDVEKMIDFLHSVHSYASRVLVCVGLGQLEMVEYVHELKSRVDGVFPEIMIAYLFVDPWGYFTYSLNAAILYAQDNGFERVAFQSVEYRIDATQVKYLVHLASNDNNILVAGPEMSGHEFTEGTNIMRGRTTPWNTFAVWNVRHLAITGFPMIGDGVAGQRDMGGVEEVSAINLLQLINPLLQAILIRFVASGIIQHSSNHTTNPTSNATESATPSIATENALESVWNTQFTEDAARQAWHDKKMASKDDRPARQQAVSGIPPGFVKHVIVRL